ncbi:MAG TPA: pseudouridine synthase [Flavobacteriaceae bacterium]|nr:pseudouridine synthase [Flavobacteriaceae bacterium]
MQDRGKAGKKYPKSKKEGTKRIGKSSPNKSPRVDKQIQDPAAGIRLNKYIANSGMCSRRDADIYIASGNVQVNGKVVTEMGHIVKLSDEVKFDGRRINPEKKEYILLNKPKGFFVTGSLTKGERTVMGLIEGASKAKLSPVGKLDTSATGLLLFTNDGTLAKNLTTPKNGLRQIYHVELDKNLDLEDLEKIREGIILEDGKVKVDEISYIENEPKRQVGLELKSVKQHIVQRLFKKLNYNIVKLDRVVYGGLTKKDLPRGRYRALTRQEIINLGMI